MRGGYVRDAVFVRLQPGERIYRTRPPEPAEPEAPTRKSWRESPGTVFLWWWLPCLLAAGFLNAGEDAAALITVGLAFVLFFAIYRPAFE